MHEAGELINWSIPNQEETTAASSNDDSAYGLEEHGQLYLIGFDYACPPVRALSKLELLLGLSMVTDNFIQGCGFECTYQKQIV